MRYFIHAVGYGSGNLEIEFNAEIEREKPIYSIQDIREIERSLARPYQSRVLIRSWQKFESGGSANDIAAEPILLGMTAEEFLAAWRAVQQVKVGEESYFSKAPEQDAATIIGDIRGKYEHVPTSSEDFATRKTDEIELEG